MYYWQLSYKSGIAPLRMYRELQCDMGPYRTVHITLYVFTHVLQVNVFLVCSDETHTTFTLLRMSGFAVGWIHYYWVQGNITRLVPHCHSCLQHSWQYWQQHSWSFPVSSELFYLSVWHYWVMAIPIYVQCPILRIRHLMRYRYDIL